MIRIWRDSGGDVIGETAMNETMNDDKSRICETKPTGENALKSPSVGPIPKNTENESDKPSPGDETTDLKSLRIGCLSICFTIIALYLGWILSRIAKGGDNTYVHQAKRYLLWPVTWPADLGGFFVDRTLSRAAAMAGWAAFVLLVARFFTATTLRSFGKAALLFALLFLASLVGRVGTELNQFNAGFN